MRAWSSASQRVEAIKALQNAISTQSKPELRLRLAQWYFEDQRWHEAAAILEPLVVTLMQHARFERLTSVLLDGDADVNGDTSDDTIRLRDTGSLDAALATLPSGSRAVVWFHAVEGFPHKEIAALMGRTESFSKSQLSRAYQRLRPLLAVPGDEAAENAALRSC